ncbi:tripartite tricarboxylate transporter permease [Jiella sp. MQZ9-1]|uniref:Tripartite tricarboxylate transporter permease n=1 Tax=Jiella flava TaxID=2816857 RepID=A0A939FX52_9HYPH|nr:tripartite tricarboxylate transporter permease [Jiella flava]MBO0663132.1 tripartite tricarboxylate transporter permease [Jiella flava]MCD2471551.1 tripartite tricarboxylate transporter permease [Jiella flava]
MVDLTFLADVWAPATVVAMIVGTALGIIIGALPGLGSVVGLSICLPFTFGMDTVPSLALLLGVYCGSVYGGSISAILINSPGTPQSAATVLDGYPMALQGLAGKALGWSTASSVAGGLISCIVLIVAAPQLAHFATRFGSIEVFALILMALTCIAAVSRGSMLKGLSMGSAGIFLSLIGTDPVTGAARFTFGIQFFTAGLDLISVVIGLFAVSEAFTRLAQDGKNESVFSGVRLMLPSLSEWKGRIGNLLRSSAIGCFIGALPGTGAATAAFISYATAKQLSPRRDNFGKGEPDGVIAAESSNNAVTGSAMIPTLALGIPGDVVTAIVLSAMVVHGITPGVRLMSEHLDVVNAIFAVLVIINILMLILAFPIVRLFGKLLAIPESYVMTGVIVFSLIGAITVRGNALDGVVAVAFGVFGYALRRGGYPLAPFVIGLVLGPQFEENLRRGLLLSDGDILSFPTHSWIALVLFLVTAGLILFGPLQTLISGRFARSETARLSREP